MKRLMVPIAILSILMFACSIPATAIPPVTTAAPVASETSIAAEPPTATAALTATETPAPQTNVTCNEVALFLDPALASGFSCVTVPEAADTSLPPFGVNPSVQRNYAAGIFLGGPFYDTAYRCLSGRSVCPVIT